MKDNKAFYEQALKTGVNPRTGKRLTVDERSRYYKILNTQYTDGKIAQMENVYKDATANQKARTMEAANAAFAASDRLKASADKDVAAAKEGSGKVGQFLVDLGYTGTQLLADTAANAIAPGAGMVSMASRVYGDASAEARREGKTAGQQALSGLKGATIEILTEKLFGGLAKAYGAGTADELVEKVADKLTKTEAGQRAAVWLINSGGEGLEEVVSDVLNPLATGRWGWTTAPGPSSQRTTRRRWLMISCWAALWGLSAAAVSCGEGGRCRCRRWSVRRTPVRWKCHSLQRNRRHRTRRRHRA